jgi:hypothetical protein
MLAGRVVIDAHRDALHIRTAQVEIPWFVDSPIVVATVSDRTHVGATGRATRRRGVARRLPLRMVRAYGD